MKGALIGIASVGILVVTVGVETANAQSYRRYGPARTYTPHPCHPKAAARFPAAFRALFRFPTPTVRKPQEVAILVTITACPMVEANDRQRPRPHTRPHAGTR